MTATGARRPIEILLVEDSPTDRLIALEALEQASMTTSLNVVENGVEAMAYLRREGKFAHARRPDLILLDLNLPKKDGREVLMEIKHDPSLKFIPVIVLTTSGADEDVARAYADHANSYIVKPVDFPRFTQALETIGKYWFEVVTLPPEGIVQRLAQSDKARPSSPVIWQGQTLGVVLVADDANLVRHWRELASEPASVRIELVHVDSLDGLREAVARLRPDVLMVELAIAGSEGLEAYRRARGAAPSAAVIVLSGDEATGEMALREGADDFLGELDRDRATWLRALRYATSKKRMQDQLRRAQRMEAIGHITSGVAHDFNNLLTVLHGHAELLSDSTAASVGDSVQGIKDVSERATQLTRQLLAFSQKRALQLEPVDLGRVVNEFSKMLRRVLGRDVHLELRLSPQAPSALADVGLIEQALLDLAIHARDAMPRGGELVLATDGVTLDRASLPHPDAYAGSFATLSVRHTGSNADSERDEPLVAANAWGRGGHVALSIAHGIAQQHRGWIALESERGVASQVRMYLPVAQPAEGVAPRAIQSSRGGTENILLVDDESPVRRMAKAILGRQGYHVLEARSGADAITTFEESLRRVDLLLTDVVMPGGMTGRELADELQRRDPNLKVIFTSGYGREQAVPGLALNEGVEFLSKPYAASRLLGAVRHALDGLPMEPEPESSRA